MRPGKNGAPPVEAGGMYSPPFRTVIRDGVKDARLRQRRFRRRMTVAVSSVLTVTVCAVGVGVSAWWRHSKEWEARADFSRRCGEASSRAHASYARVSELFDEAKSATERLDESYDLERLFPLVDSAPPAPTRLDCGVVDEGTVVDAGDLADMYDALADRLEDALGR